MFSSRRGSNLLVLTQNNVGAENMVRSQGTLIGDAAEREGSVCTPPRLLVFHREELCGGCGAAVSV